MTAAGDRTRREIVAFIVDFRDRYGVSPSVREIADGVDRSINTTHTHIQRLIESEQLRVAPIPGLPGFGRDVARCLLPTQPHDYNNQQETTPS